MFNSKVESIICVIFLIVFAYMTVLNADDKKSVITDMELFELEITSPNWMERIKAARSMSEKEGIDKNEVAALIINQLKNEIDSPTPGKPRHGSYFTNISDYITRQYILGLADLGQDIKNHLNDEMNLSSGELKKYLILSLGFLKDENVHDDIRDLLANDPDGNIRATAARTLAKYIDVNDIPLLKKALKDTARVKNTSDVFYEGRPEFRYPVRQEAAVPLRKMGFKVTPDSAGNYTVEEK